MHANVSYISTDNNIITPIYVKKKYICHQNVARNADNIIITPIYVQKKYICPQSVARKKCSSKTTRSCQSAKGAVTNWIALLGKVNKMLLIKHTSRNKATAGHKQRNDLIDH